MNIQTGLGLEARAHRLAYSWWRESCGPVGQEEKKHASLSSAFSSLCSHMLRGNYNSTYYSSLYTLFSDVFVCFLNLLLNEAFLYAVLSLLIHFASF